MRFLPDLHSDLNNQEIRTGRQQLIRMVLPKNLLLLVVLNHISQSIQSFLLLLDAMEGHDFSLFCWLIEVFLPLP